VAQLAGDCFPRRGLKSYLGSISCGHYSGTCKPQTAATLEWPKDGPSSGFWRSLDGPRHFGPSKEHAYNTLRHS